MTKRTSALILASVASVFIAGVVMVGIRHNGGAAQPAQSTHAAVLTDDDAVTAVRRANLPVSNLVVRSVEGIAVMRGEAPNRETADRAAATVRLAGFQRVANLIRVQAAPDDDAIRRAAERKLTQFTGLNGCTFFVSADGGVLHVRGEVQSPEQEDLTRRALRSIPGVHRVETEFVRPQAASS